MPAGIAFDGSPWVTAASSVALVFASVGMAAAGGLVIARRAADGSLGPPPAGLEAPTGRRQPAVPLRPAGGAEPTGVPAPAESVDVVE